jgi:hypothetical protein
MSDQAPAITTPEQPAVSPTAVSQTATAPGALRVLGLVAVSVGVAALAGAAFVLSYSGLHAVALQAGISARLAKGYPLILDVLLVVILAAILWLRSAGWPSKLLAWACLLALLAAAAWADALHAAGHRLPARPAAVAAAILPWALVLIAFALLLTMLHHARVRRAATPRPPAVMPVYVPPPAPTAPLVPGFPGREPATEPTSRPAARPEPPRPAYTRTSPDTLRLVVPRQAATEAGDLAMDEDAALDDPSSDEAVPDPASHLVAGGGTPAEPEVGAGQPGDAAAEAGDAQADEDAAAASDNAAADDTEPEDTEPEDAEPEDAEPDDTGPDDTEPDGKQADSDGEQADPDADEADADDTDVDDTAMPVFHRMWSSPTPGGDD